ncbi:MAG: hypothetical protein JWM68_4452 [Verrucomicrobiales bacterium]|nr:hypothetical protein [Verrucomicrobiales bacterium]
MDFAEFGRIWGENGRILRESMDFGLLNRENGVLTPGTAGDRFRAGVSLEGLAINR